MSKHEAHGQVVKLHFLSYSLLSILVMLYIPFAYLKLAWSETIFTPWKQLFFLPFL